MAEIPIGENHKAYLAKMQHVGEWLQAEKARLEAEFAHVAQQELRHAAELRAFLQRAYGLDAQHTSVTLDIDRGVLVTPNAPDAPVADTTPMPDVAVEPLPFLRRDTPVEDATPAEGGE